MRRLSSSFVDDAEVLCLSKHIHSQDHFYTLDMRKVMFQQSADDIAS